MTIRRRIAAVSAACLWASTALAAESFDAIVFRTGFEPFVCPNGSVEDTETCDDGAAAPGDGCSDRCRVEFGHYCDGAPSVCVTVCGDGAPAGTETCDDNGTANGDGCSAQCLVEAGFQCSGAPSACTTTCGDGVTAGTETCDDGDAFDGNGCSAQCSIEPGFQCSGAPSVCLTGTCTTNASGTNGDDTLIGTSGNDCLFGFAGNDMLQGNDGNDALDAGAGDDTLDGGAGDDSLAGSQGDDVYIVTPGDTVSETSAVAAEIDTVRASGTWTLGANLEDLVLTGAENLDGTGNALDNQITGNFGANALNGADGNDTLTGSLGNDTISGGPGNDSLTGGAGTDSLVGGTGNDSYTVESASDMAVETSTLATEIDAVTATASDWTLGPNFENLTIGGIGGFGAIGNGLANVLTGNAGGNSINGLAGNDTIDGGGGADAIRGGAGIDTIAPGAGADDVVLDSPIVDTKTIYDTVTGFAPGSDQVAIDMSDFIAALSSGTFSGIGDGDAVLELALTRAAPGGWAMGNELVVFTTNSAGSVADAANVVVRAGVANAAIPTDYRILFVIDNGVDTGVWMFESDDANTAVVTTELTLLAVLDGTPATSTADYLFIP